MSLYKRYLFFKQHGAEWVGHASEQALALARAEMWADAYGMEFEWQENYDDYENSLGDHTYWCRDAAQGKEHTHEVYWCQATWNDRVQASLGAIVDPSSNHRRVIEAELALEAKAEADKFIYY